MSHSWQRSWDREWQWFLGEAYAQQSSGYNDNKTPMPEFKNIYIAISLLFRISNLKQKLVNLLISNLHICILNVLNFVATIRHGAFINSNNSLRIWSDDIYEFQSISIASYVNRPKNSYICKHAVLLSCV